MQGSGWKILIRVQTNRPACFITGWPKECEQHPTVPSVDILRWQCVKVKPVFCPDAQICFHKSCICVEALMHAIVMFKVLSHSERSSPLDLSVTNHKNCFQCLLATGSVDCKLPSRTTKRQQLADAFKQLFHCICINHWLVG